MNPAQNRSNRRERKEHKDFKPLNKRNTRKREGSVRTHRCPSRFTLPATLLATNHKELPSKNAPGKRQVKIEPQESERIMGSACHSVRQKFAHAFLNRKSAVFN